VHACVDGLSFLHCYVTLKQFLFQELGGGRKASLPPSGKVQPYQIKLRFKKPAVNSNNLGFSLRSKKYNQFGVIAGARSQLGRQPLWGEMPARNLQEVRGLHGEAGGVSTARSGKKA
jgi:hypothetical protein